MKKNEFLYRILSKKAESCIKEIKSRNNKVLPQKENVHVQLIANLAN